MTLFTIDTSEHCWEYMNCPQDIRKECLAYESDVKESCWVLNQVGGRDGCSILNTCKRCPWFLKNNFNLNKEGK